MLLDRIDVAVFLLGLPGAGKGTQAQLLSEAGWSHINVGGLIRSEAGAKTSWGKYLDTFMSRGDLVPSADVQALISRKLRYLQLPIVIEGYPRRLSEAHTLTTLCGHKTLLIPILLEITRPKALSRLATRLICSTCEQVAIDSHSLDCPNCGAPLVSRDDDRHNNIVSRRLQLYDEETVPLINFLNITGSLETVSGDNQPVDVHADILASILRRIHNT
jgi:adenylate kinase